MKIFTIILIFFSILGCSKPKTVLICGDHICVNKYEAEQYFEENLSIEVKIIDKNKSEKIDLVQINLKKNNSGKKIVNITPKKETANKIKILSNDEIELKKKQLKKQKMIKKKLTKISNKNNTGVAKELKKNNVKLSKFQKNEKTNVSNETKRNKVIQTQKTVNKTTKKTVDVCTIVEKCNIDEISKYLIELGKSKNYPDITIKQ